jgi:hypothetical protein
MDVASIAAAFIAQQAAQLQIAAAAKLLRMNAQTGDDAAKLLAVAQQNLDRLANVASGIGANLDVHV